jgi:hypothetical protein
MVGMGLSEVFQLDGLMCEYENLSYDFKSHTGALHMANGSSCDMANCIALFERIDPKVSLIRTFAGSAVATRYKRSPETGGWIAYP